MSLYCIKIAIGKRKCAAICAASPPLNPPTRLRHFPPQVWAQQQPLGQLAVFYFHVIARRAAGLKDALLGYAKWRRWAFDRIPFSTFYSHTFFSYFFFLSSLPHANPTCRNFHAKLSLATSTACNFVLRSSFETLRVCLLASSRKESAHKDNCNEMPFMWHEKTNNQPTHIHSNTYKRLKPVAKRNIGKEWQKRIENTLN